MKNNFFHIIPNDSESLKNTDSSCSPLANYKSLLFWKQIDKNPVPHSLESQFLDLFNYRVIPNYGMLRIAKVRIRDSE